MAADLWRAALKADGSLSPFWSLGEDLWRAMAQVAAQHIKFVGDVGQMFKMY